MLSLLFADARGTLYAHPHLRAAGMTAGIPVPLAAASPVPYGARLMALPGWDPVGYDPATGTHEILQEVKIGRAWRRVCAVAAVPPPGYLRLQNPAAVRTGRAPPLPLWAYTAAGAGPRGDVMAAVRVDLRRRWDTAYYDTPRLQPAIAAWLVRHPDNRIVRQLARCATEYFCATARNLFLGRYEAALPLARACNCRCIGCISKQHGAHPCSQERLGFVPRTAEAVAIAAAHLSRAKDPVVSFGQGCEGEPLTIALLLEEIIRRTREATARGVFNMNTNGSRPAAFGRLVTAGLGSVRVSLNSAIPARYNAYVRPHGYSFGDVKGTVRLAASRGVFTSINLLVYPGVTDTPVETQAIIAFVKVTGARFIQLRNLSIDPAIFPPRGAAPGERPLGMAAWLAQMKKALPGTGFGCYNPTPTEIPRLLAGPGEG